MIWKHILLLMLVLAVSVQGVSAGTQITVFDLMENSDTEFLIYNASGASVVNLSSNGSNYTLDNGSYVVQVLPAVGDYSGNPLWFIEIILAGLPVVFGIILVLTGAVALWLLGKKIAEVRI